MSELSPSSSGDTTDPEPAPHSELPLTAGGNGKPKGPWEFWGQEQLFCVCALLYIEPGKYAGLEHVAFVAKNIIWKAHFRQPLLSVASYTNQVLQIRASSWHGHEKSYRG